MSRPTLETFFENAIRNAGRPPFGPPSGFAGNGRYAPRLSTRPRQQQAEQFYPAVVRLPDQSAKT